LISLVNDFNNTPEGSTIAYSTIPNEAITTSYAEVTEKIRITKLLGSRTKYWVKLHPLNTPSTIDYYNVTRHTVDNQYMFGSAYERLSGKTWSPYNTDLYFKIKTPNWIYEDYPREDLSVFSFPRCAVDFIGRPRIDERYIDISTCYYYLTLMVTVYSRYPDELDDIISKVDRVLFIERGNIPNVEIINPAAMTPVTTTRELFVRSIQYQCKYRMVKG